MPRTCEECGSSWDGRASFCGRCGGLLDDDLATRGTSDQRVRRWWRRPWVGALGVAVVVGGAVAAVPRLSIERTPPVDGEIGVPETEDLNAAPASAGQRPSAAPPPQLTCTVAGEPTECVAWSRLLLPPEDPTDGYSGWAAPMEGHVVVAHQSAFEVVDADTGTRLWRDESLAGHYPVATVDGGVVLDGPDELSMRSLADGAMRWTASSNHGHTVVAGGVLVTGGMGVDGTVRGLDPADGSVAWEQALPWRGNPVQGLTDGRVVVEEVDTTGTGGVREAIGFAVLDAATGAVITTFETAIHGWFELLDDRALAVTHHERAPEDPNLAGDGGGTIRAIDLHTGEQAWTARLPTTDGRPSVLEGLVVVPSTGRIVGLDLATGQPRWDVPLPDGWAVASHPSSRWSAAPTTEDLRSPTVVVHAPDGAIRGLDPGNGEVRWEQQVDRGVGHVVATHDLVVAHGANGLLTILDPATGRERVRVPQGRTSLMSLDPVFLVDHLSGHVIRIVASGVEVS